MGNDQKDRFGDKLRDLEHAREEKFFAEREKEALAKLRDKAAGSEPPDEQDEARGEKDGNEAD